MMRVLVVDDDVMVARLHSALTDRVPGFTVTGVAHSGGEALRAVRELEPDLVLLDLYLPDMHGLDVLRALRGADGRPDGGPDVLVITASRDTAAVRGAQRGGAVQYLIKPFEGATLQGRLRTWARERRQLDTLTRAEQDDVDRIFGTDPGSGPDGTHRTTNAESSEVATDPDENSPAAAYPKGLAPETAALVGRTLEAVGDEEGVSASECAARSGLSRASSRRYLEYFVKTGKAGVTLRYGTTGRPERLYHPVGQARTPGT